MIIQEQLMSSTLRHCNPDMLGFSFDFAIKKKLMSCGVEKLFIFSPAIISVLILVTKNFLYFCRTSRLNHNWPVIVSNMERKLEILWG